MSKVKRRHAFETDFHVPTHNTALWEIDRTKAERDRALSGEVLAYAERAERGEVSIKYEHCAGCLREYHSGEGGHASCPRCTPTPLLRSLEDVLQDRETWPGHGLVWDIARGPRGRWVPMGNRVLVEFEHIRELAVAADLMNEPGMRPGQCAVAASAAVLRRLRGIVDQMAAPERERAEQEQKRASHLADRCGELEQTLRDKRAECDNLRDELARERRRNGSLR